MVLGGQLDAELGLREVLAELGLDQRRRVVEQLQEVDDGGPVEGGGEEVAAGERRVAGGVLLRGWVVLGAQEAREPLGVRLDPLHRLLVRREHRRPRAVRGAGASGGKRRRRQHQRDRDTLSR